ncbi:MAG: Zn-ribbon domain-containing OB-fold protein [Methanomassiliicoccales archaeon]|nr:MAG: Zn-ribbon domain-containing OB-fold protein [Methanomassiliicoccales archaeon]
MTFLERSRDPEAHKHWYGDMEASYLYSTGIAGEKFFSTLRDKGNIMGASCPKCKKVFLPPRMYCEICFSETKNWKDVGKEGKVETYSVAHVDIEGNPLDEPIVYGLIRFPRTEGGLVHVISVKPEKVKIGMKVKAKLKPKKERKGSILDIASFG